jgi:hypothetical protein
MFGVFHPSLKYSTITRLFVIFAESFNGLIAGTELNEQMVGSNTTGIFITSDCAGLHSDCASDCA